MSDTFKFAQLQPYSLYGAGVIIGDTSITLKSMTDIDGNALSMSGAFGDIGFGTLEPGNGNQEEQISFTGLVNNANGTTTLTGIKNVDFLYPYTQTSGLAKTHPGSSTFIISNTAGFYDKLTSKSDDEDITGKWTFQTVPATTEDPVAGDDMTRRSWVLSQINGGPVSMDSLIVNGTAGETIVAGNLVYLKTSDGFWYKTDADTSSTVLNAKMGIAQGAGSVGVAISGGVLTEGIDPINTGLSAGATYYASNTAGGISTSAGTNSRAIGKANAAGLLVFDPYFNATLSSGQVDALAAGGEFGSPSSTNKFLTQQITSDGATDQSQTVQDGTVQVGEANATLKKNLLAQSFVPTFYGISSVRLYKSADTGTFSGTVTISLQADTAGSPSGTPLATMTMTNVVWESLSVGEFNAKFASEYTSLTPGSLYWIVIQTSTSDNSNHPNLGTSTGGGYAAGSAKFKNTTDGWTLIPSIDLYFKTIDAIDNKVVKTDSTGGITPLMIKTSKKLFVSTTPSSIVNGNSGAAKTLFSVVVPGGTLSTNNAIRVRAYFSAVGLNSADAVDFNLFYPSTGATASVNSPGATISDYNGYFEAYLVGNGATNSQKVQGNVTLFKGTQTTEINGDATVGISKSLSIGASTTIAIDSTVDQVLNVSAYYGGSTNAANDLTADYCIVEIIS